MSLSLALSLSLSLCVFLSLSRYGATECVAAFELFKQLQGREPDKVACKVLLMLALRTDQLRIAAEVLREMEVHAIKFELGEVCGLCVVVLVA